MTSASQWSGGLGQSWRDHVDGLEATLAPVNDALCEALSLNGAARIADIGCGGGAFARHLAETMPAGLAITGIDISSDLVEAATARAPSPNLQFRCLDAQSERWTGERFDRLTSRFGVMFFDDEEAAFVNLKSWLAPGGRFAFAVWADLQSNPWMGVVRDVANEFIDVPQPTTNAPDPFRYADVDRFITLLQRGGFSNIGAQDWTGSFRYGGGLPAREAAEFGLSAFWPDLTAMRAEYKRAVEMLTEILREHEGRGVVGLPGRAFIVTGCG